MTSDPNTDPVVVAAPTQLIRNVVCPNSWCRYYQIRRTDAVKIDPDGLIRPPRLLCGGCGNEPVIADASLQP